MVLPEFPFAQEVGVDGELCTGPTERREKNRPALRFPGEDGRGQNIIGKGFSLLRQDLFFADSMECQ